MISLTGQEEAQWGDTITFRGDSVAFRFVAEADGGLGAEGSAVMGGSELEDWGFRFTVRIIFEAVYVRLGKQKSMTSQLVRRI